MKQKILLVLMIVISVAAFYLLFNQLNKISKNGTTVKLPDKTQLKIAATFFPIYDIAKNILGDKGEIVQILPQGASPHTYEPNIQDIQKLSDTKLIFMIGLGIDNWALEVANQSQEKITVVDMSQYMTLLLPATAPDEGGTYDPHYWLSIDNAGLIAANVAAALAKVDPANTNYYESNLLQYLQKLMATLDQAKQKIQLLQNRQIITFHNAFNYFAQELDLEIVATIEPFPGKEPTASYLAEIGEIINQYDIKVLFKEPQLSDVVVTALANDYGATVYTLDPEGALPEITTFIELYEYNVDSIVSALK